MILNLRNEFLVEFQYFWTLITFLCIKFYGQFLMNRQVMAV